MLSEEPQQKRSCTPTHSASGQSEIEKLKEKYKIGACIKPSTPIQKQQSAERPSSSKSYEPVSRNNEAISKEIEKLDRKIKEIELSKKELNINFAPPSEELVKDRSRSSVNTPVRNASVTVSK